MTYACEQYLEPGERMCAKTHCTLFGDTSQYKRFCLCKKSDGTTIPDCQVKGPTVPMAFKVCYNRKTREEILSTPEECLAKHDEDKDWIYTDCYCCCSCFAWDTRIAVSANDVRVIQEFQAGDRVHTASVTAKNGELHVTWKKRRIVMSSGTGPNSTGQEMVVVQYGDDGEIIVTPDHLFLAPSGKLQRADRLKAGDDGDYLVDAEGRSVKVAGVHLGLHRGGIHHISTTFTPGSKIPLDGHLLCSNGVISADFLLQISQSNEEVSLMLSEDHLRRPVIGSPEYAHAAGTGGSTFSSGTTPKSRPIRAAFFEPHESIHTPPGVPEWAPRFLTKEQAAKIAKAPHVDMTVERNKSNYEYLKRVFAGFFPSVKLHLEWADETPNLYAFRQFGVDTVYVSGRLLRTKCIERDGLTLILAHGIARLLGISVLDPRGYACTGAADFDAISYVIPTAFYFEKVEPKLKALDQVRTLFGYADMKAAGDPCSAPSLDCRLKALDEALAGGELPRCAGGVPPAALQLTGAECREVEGQRAIVVSFNLAVMVSSAQDVTKYTLSPETVVTTALVDPEDEAQVVLNVTWPEPLEGEYTLEVHDILAADGSSLSPDHRKANFQVRT